MQLAKTTLNNEEMYIKAKNIPLANQIFKKEKADEDRRSSSAYSMIKLIR